MGRKNNREDKSRRQGRDSKLSSNFEMFSNRSFNSAPRELHKATCADCGNECDVPFKPTEGRPVYCRACYSKHAPKRF